MGSKNIQPSPFVSPSNLLTVSLLFKLSWKPKDVESGEFSYAIAKKGKEWIGEKGGPE